MAITYRIVEHHGTYFPTLNITAGEYWLLGNRRFYHNPSEKEIEEACICVETQGRAKRPVPDNAKLIACLELAAHHNECAELLLDAAAEIRRLHSLMAEQAAHNGLGAGSIPAASTKE